MMLHDTSGLRAECFWLVATVPICFPEADLGRPDQEVQDTDGGRHEAFQTFGTAIADACY